MKFNKKVLQNGLTVIHEKRDVPVTTVMLGVKYGAAYETAKEKGIAHFIEHLCFKGTEKRTVRQIAEEVEGVGGDLNAFTHEEITAYHVKLPSEHLGAAMDVLFDVFFNATFPEEEVAKEANVICEEIKMYRDNPRAHVMERIKSSLYEDPFGMFIAGTEENVRGMTRDQLFDRHRSVYVPANSVLCVVGDNDFDEVVSMAEKLSVQRDSEDVVLLDVKIRVLSGSEKRKDLAQANVALGFHFPFSGDKERYAAEVFAMMLGHGMSSRLFREVREKRGLVYGVKTEIDLGESYGYMVIWAGTDPEKVDEVVRICSEEYSKMTNVSKKELDEAKVRVVGNRKVESEGSSETALNLILEEISGDAKDYYDYEKNVAKVSLDDIKAIAKKSNFASFSLGP